MVLGLSSRKSQELLTNAVSIISQLGMLLFDHDQMLKPRPISYKCLWKRKSAALYGLVAKRTICLVVYVVSDPSTFLVSDWSVWKIPKPLVKFTDLIRDTNISLNMNEKLLLSYQPDTLRVYRGLSRSLHWIVAVILFNIDVNNFSYLLFKTTSSI